MYKINLWNILIYQYDIHSIFFLLFLNVKSFLTFVSTYFESNFFPNKIENNFSCGETEKWLIYIPRVL